MPKGVQVQVLLSAPRFPFKSKKTPEGAQIAHRFPATLTPTGRCGFRSKSGTGSRPPSATTHRPDPKVPLAIVPTAPQRGGTPGANGGVRNFQPFHGVTWATSASGLISRNPLRSLSNAHACGQLAEFPDGVSSRFPVDRPLTQLAIRMAHGWKAFDQAPLPPPPWPPAFPS